MSSSRKPHFFCESCGSEVPLDAKNCPRCGQLFVSVRCPDCGFTGEEGLFAKGCPACGYSASGKNRAASTPPVKGNSYEGSAGPLPLWIYLLAFGALLAIAAALITKLFFS